MKRRRRDDDRVAWLKEQLEPQTRQPRRIISRLASTLPQTHHLNAQGRHFQRAYTNAIDV